MSIGITDHAVLRFRQRVRPDLDRDAALAVLLRAVEDEDPITTKPFSSCTPADAWLNVAFGAYLVLSSKQRTAGYSAVTCIVNPALHVRQEAA